LSRAGHGLVFGLCPGTHCYLSLRRLAWPLTRTLRYDYIGRDRIAATRGPECPLFVSAAQRGKAPYPGLQHRPTAGHGPFAKRNTLRPSQPPAFDLFPWSSWMSPVSRRRVIVVHDDRPGRCSNVGDVFPAVDPGSSGLHHQEIAQAGCGQLVYCRELNKGRPPERALVPGRPQRREREVFIRRDDLARYASGGVRVRPCARGAWMERARRLDIARNVEIKSLPTSLSRYRGEKSFRLVESRPCDAGHRVVVRPSQLVRCGGYLESGPHPAAWSVIACMGERAVTVRRFSRRICLHRLFGPCDTPASNRSAARRRDDPRRRRAAGLDVNALDRETIRRGWRALSGGGHGIFTDYPNRLARPVFTDGVQRLHSGRGISRPGSATKPVTRSDVRAGGVEVQGMIVRAKARSG